MSRRLRTRLLGPALAALAALALAAPAAADYEQAGHFAGEGEAGQFAAQATGGAVNLNGAGGVEPGSVYFSIGTFGNRIVRYSPSGEFKEAWGWGITKNSSLLNTQFERCGPALGSECYLDGFVTGSGGTHSVSEEATTYCGAATDPAGDLYVVDREGAGRIYGPSGSLLTEFKLDSNNRENCNLAVDSSGAIYAVVRRVGPNAPAQGYIAEVVKLEPVGGEYPPTSATKYTGATTIYGSQAIVAAAPGYGIASIAVDPADQRLYATEATSDEMQAFKQPTEPFKLKCEGNETGTLPANASGPEIKAALQSAPVECGTVTVSGGVIFGSWTVIFEGSLAETHVAPLEVIKAGGNEEAAEVAVGSTIPHITVYEPDGTRVEAIDPGISGAEYYGIGVYGTNGDIYVADKAHEKAYVLNSSGTLQTEFDGSGCEKGAFAEMQDPTLAVDQSNGNVLVSDINAHGLIDEFDSSGSCLLSVNRPFAEAGPSQVAIDNSGGAADRVAYVTSKNGATSSVYAYAPPSGSSRAEMPVLSHELPGPPRNPESVAIDQQTGYVYVLNETNYNATGNPQVPTRRHDLIEVFSADGSELIAHFGDAAAPGEKIAESPEKIHEYSHGGIAVDESGKIYVGDADGVENRAMCFRPEASGDYRHYVYCGRSQDVKLNGSVNQLALDEAGHLYRANTSTISEYSLAEPVAPLCSYNTHTTAQGTTVNPATGEVFYFARQSEVLFRLAPCDPEQGEFEKAQAPIVASPATKELLALAINPILAWGSGRAPGVLYAADSGSHEIEGVAHEGIGDVFASAEVQPPTIQSESVSNTRTTSTILRAEIDPHGFGTNYVFQYESEAEYEANEPGERFAGAMEAPAGGGEIGAGGVGQAAAAVTGLDPDTVYRFRVVASSECDEATGEPCVTDGEALRFATYPLYPPGLPDHRAYELVSPAQKHGGEVIPADPAIGSCGNCKPNPAQAGISFPVQSSPDGEALAYMGQPFNPFEGAVNYDSYVSRRAEAGWQTTALIPALPPGRVMQLAFDSSLEHGLLDVEVGEPDLEIQNTSEPGSTAPLVAETNYRGAGELKLSYGGHSADFSRQLFAANDSLTKKTPFAPEPPDPGASKSDLYEWHEGRLALVNVAPNNETVIEGAEFASLSPDTHAVSEDGSRIFFTDEAGALYVREAGKLTREVLHPGDFLSASPDGMRVLLSDGCLYSLATEDCTDLTEGKEGFQGVVGQSRDLSRVYFVDGEALAPGAEARTCALPPGGSQEGEEEQEGKLPAGYGCNLYFHEAGAPPRFVATLLARDNTSLGDWAASPGARAAEASPNGRFLAFSSRASLTDYDNVGRCGRGAYSEELGGYPVAPGPCTEAYLYDSATGKLVCASCNPTGEAPLGETHLRRIFQGPTFPQPRYLSNEGRLYFDTQDSLVARDTNEGVEDVYEYEPNGAGDQGTCERDAGCTFLISAGTEPGDSNLIAVDETGKNVFFDTRDQLTLKDRDELLDIYDAREGGGIGAETEVARAECQGEACQAPVYAPNDATPASSSFEGPGNPREAKTKKHKKRHKKAHRRHAHKKHKRHPHRGARHRKQRVKRHHARAAKRNHGGAK